MKTVLSKGGKASINLTVTLNASDNGSLVGTAFTIKDAYTDETLHSLTFNGQPITVKLKVGTPYKITGVSKNTYTKPTVVEGVAYEDTSAIVFYQKGLRYGFKRTKNESDPTARIAYLYDAVGMEPASTNLETNVFLPGSWGTFINEVATPVMLSTGGTELYELDRNNQTKRADGNASEISNNDSAANAMVRFEKYKWVKRYEDTTHEYVIFSDIQFDETYHDYAFINTNGEHMDRMYYGMFKGTNISSTLRSLADKSIMVEQTRNTEVAYAQKNGSGWDTIYNSGWQFVADLLTLISKSDDSQAKFGYGRCLSSNTAKINTGSLKAYPGFWGDDNQTSDVKVFWIEGFWGNVWEGMRGLVIASGRIKTKMYPPYNFDGSGYTDTGIVPSGTSGGFISSASVDDLSGFVPKVASGSGTSYYCDGLWFDTSKTTYALVGGAWTYGLICGSRCVTLSNAPSHTSAIFGSRLSYVPLQNA